MSYEKIPFELRCLHNWCVWRYETVNDKLTKVPYNPRGFKCNTVDANTWSSFQDCVAVVGSYNGIGFVFSENDPYCGIDLDKIMQQSEAIQNVHRQIYEQFNSYSEFSPSGTGIHIICKGVVPTGRNDQAKGVEIYSSGRFFTFTGNAANNIGIADRSDLANILWSELGGTSRKSAFERVVDFSTPQLVEDIEIYNKAVKAKDGALFQMLWQGEWQGKYPSQSEADLSLINLIQFYTKNPEQIVRMFRISGLGQRDKAKRGDYLARLIGKSFDRELPPIDFSFAPPALIPETPAQNPFKVPPGLLGEIAAFIYAAAPRPVPEAALAGAIVMLAGIVGKAYNVSGTGLNQYVLFLADTAIGKEQMAKGTSRLMSDVSLYCPMATDFMFNKAASGQGLAKEISDSKTGGCGFVIYGEFGYTLQNISDDRASPSDQMLLGNLLDLYNKSGKYDNFLGKSYSNSDKNIKTTVGPAFSLLGEGVPQSFYGGINEKTMLSGLLPRFIIIEYNGQRQYLNKNHNTAKPSTELMQHLAYTIERAYTGIRANNVHDVQLDDIATSMNDEMEKKTTDFINSTTRNVIKACWSRAPMKILKLAALCAVGINPNEPIINEECYIWAKNIIEYETKNMVKKFESGDLLSNTENLEADQLQVVGNYMADFYRKGVPTKGIRTSHEMVKDGVFMLSDIATKCHNIAAFRKDFRRDTKQKIERAVETLKGSEVIIEFTDAAKYNKSGRMVKIVEYDELLKFLDRL